MAAQRCPSQSRRCQRLGLGWGVMTMAILSLVVVATAAPKAELWQRWQQRDDMSMKWIDHVAWDQFLRAHVKFHPSGISRVTYASVNPRDRQGLQRYLSAMQALPISTFNGQEQKAYWINLYNALTVSIILDHYPVVSIRDIDISPGLFSDGPWGAKLLTIEKQRVSLNDIEHRILRPIWQDNRVHYALNCASLGCPNLASMAYTAYNLEELLESSAREYVNHPRGVAFEQDTLVVSSIYVWFKADFGGNDEGILQHLQQYARAPLSDRLRRYQGRLKKRYDWELNG